MDNIQYLVTNNSYCFAQVSSRFYYRPLRTDCI